MKLLISLAAVLVSASSFAMPAVGDYSMYNVTISQNGAAMTGTYELGLTDKDATTGNYKMKTVVTIEGQQQAMEDSVAATDLLTDEVVAQVMTNCAAYGGVMGTYIGPDFSVPACILPQQSGEIQIAQVPFGIAKQIQIDEATGRTVTLELQKFTAGK